MYAQVEKPKENKSREVANSISQKKGNRKQGFVDNRQKAFQLNDYHQKIDNSKKYIGNTPFANPHSTASVVQGFWPFTGPSIFSREFWRSNGEQEEQAVANQVEQVEHPAEIVNHIIEEEPNIQHQVGGQPEIEREQIELPEMTASEFTEILKNRAYFMGFQRLRDLQDDLNVRFRHNERTNFTDRLHATWREYHQQIEPVIEEIEVPDNEEQDGMAARPLLGNNWNIANLEGHEELDEHDQGIIQLRIDAANEGRRAFHLHGGVGNVLTMDVTGTYRYGGQGRGDARIQFLQDGHMRIVGHNGQRLF